MKVIKRDGKKVEFDGDKIKQAIKKAIESTNIEYMDYLGIVDTSVKMKLLTKGGDVHIEEIQDIVENTLMEMGLSDVARNYIRYRDWRNRERKRPKLDKFISDVIDLNNVENENANMPEWVFTAKKERIVDKVLEEYAEEYLLTDRVRKYKKDNLIYIHDFSHYALGTHNCTLLDLDDMLKKGFKTHNGDVRQPKNIRSAAQLTAVIMQCGSNVQFGGISVANLDYDLAPYVDMSFRKIFNRNLKLLYDVTIKDVEKEYGRIELSNKKLENTKYKKVYKASVEEVENETYQAMEGLIHNLNTLQSRSGDQLPFTSVNYGLDTSPEGRMISKNFLKCRMDGVGENHTTPIFPIGIFKHKQGVNANPGEPNYDLKQLAIESLSKRIYPNFANVDAPHLLEPVDKHTTFATMGCRTALGKDRHGLQGYDGRGNISPVTINLPKIGIKHGISLGDELDLYGFWDELDDVIDVAIKALVSRFEWQGKQKAKSAPFIYENQMLKGKKLNPEDEVRDVLKHGTLAIGYIGLSNMLVALFGKHHGESKQALDFGLKVIKHIDDRAKQASKDYDLNFSTYATPAEGLCNKWAKALREEFGKIEGVTDRKYINNSHHIPVYYPCSIKEKLDIEAKFAPLATGGNITYVELDGNARNNKKALENIINYAMSIGIPYLALNHPIDECTNCGYEGIIGSECPQCHKKDGEIYIKRLRRVTGYITSSYKEFFNEGKKQEVEDRYVHSKHKNDLNDLLEE